MLSIAFDRGVVIAMEMIGDAGDIPCAHSPLSLAKYASRALRNILHGKQIRWRKTRSGNRQLLNRAFSLNGLISRSWN